MAPRDRHLPDEVLHAYAAGEIDPAKRAAQTAHLDRCAACRERLDNVRAVRGVIARHRPVEPDDLAWRRLQMRVRAELDEQAQATSTTLDLTLGSRWVTAGLAAVAAVALLVWFAPRKAPPPRAPVARADGVRHVHTRGSAVDLALRSGVELELGARGRLEVQPGEGSSATLVLATGTLEVRDLRPPAVRRPIRVFAAPYWIRAKHADFVVRRLAGGAEVEVRRGAVEVRTDPDAASEPVALAAGQRKRFADAQAVAELRPQAPHRAPRAPSAPARAEPSRAVDEAPVEAPAAAPSVAPAPPPPVVNVSVEAPSDPQRRQLLAARRAYFVDGNLERAIELAAAVRTETADGADRRAALEILCQAHTAREDAAAAVEACGALLERTVGELPRRMLHKQLADIHRAQRSDCVAAIQHYNHVLVFGRSTPLDDEARLFRAECAIQTGDTTLAQRDLTQLEASPTFRRADALERLRDRLNETIDAQDRARVTDER